MGCLIRVVLSSGVSDAGWDLENLDTPFIAGSLVGSENMQRLGGDSAICKIVYCGS